MRTSRLEPPPALASESHIADRRRKCLFAERARTNVEETCARGEEASWAHRFQRAHPVSAVRRSARNAPTHSPRASRARTRLLSDHCRPPAHLCVVCSACAQVRHTPREAIGRGGARDQHVALDQDDHHPRAQPARARGRRLAPAPAQQAYQGGNHVGNQRKGWLVTVSIMQYWSVRSARRMYERW